MESVAAGIVIAADSNVTLIGVITVDEIAMMMMTGAVVASSRSNERSTHGGRTTSIAIDVVIAVDAIGSISGCSDSLTSLGLERGFPPLIEHTKLSFKALILLVESVEPLPVAGYAFR